MTAFRYLTGVLFQKIGIDIMSSPDTVNFDNDDFNVAETPTGTLKVTIPSSLTIKKDTTEIVDSSPGTNIIRFKEADAFDVTEPVSRTALVELAREFLPSKQAVFYDDFLISKQADQTVGELNWNYVFVNTGTVVWCARTLEVGHPGTVRLTTSATINSDIKLHARTTGNTNTLGLKGTTPSVIYMASIASVSVGAGSMLQIVGLVENLDTPGVGIYFRATDNGNWYAVTNDGTETATDTTVAQADAWKRFEYRVNSTGTSIAFYIDGTLRATHTTDIPTTGLKAIYYIKTTASGAKVMDIDYFFLKINALDR